MSAIEVLKRIIEESKYYSKEGKYICPVDKLQLDQSKVDTFDKVLLTLEQKEDNRKQGALEELRNILKESEILFEKNRDFRKLYTDLQVIIDLRIKELEEKEEVKK